MMKKTTLLFCTCILLSFSVWAQTYTVSESELRKNIGILASDSLMGRESGTPGEIMARDYIIGIYKEIGLKPLFPGDSYTQTFIIKGNPECGDSNFLMFNKKVLKFKSDFFPLPYTSVGSAKSEIVKVGYGIVAPDLKYDDYQGKTDLSGKIFVIEMSLPGCFSTDSKYYAYREMQDRVDTAVAHGAAGIIFINSDKNIPNPTLTLTNKIASSKVPVIFADQQASKMLQGGKKIKAQLTVDIKRKSLTAYNIAGFIDNGKPTTVVIGGHYDHLGYGSDNSLYVGEPAIHNGADDNASGTAAVIEIAKYLKTSPAKNNNYIFIAFSAEEKGLIGSSFFTKSEIFNNFKINYMLNFDMVGRLDSVKKNLDIMGSGTAGVWDTLINTTKSDNFNVKKSTSGYSSSDQLSFYLKDIPVLFFFTGIHPDYHKPSDDADKINYKGEVAVINYAIKLIEKADTVTNFTFIKTKDSETFKRPAKGVTLGVIPDHSFDGVGLRIDGVSQGKPAEKAGLKAGDIIIKLGSVDVKDIFSYMKALAALKKGDTTIVIFKRENEIIEKEINL
jgi:aminopeptidase YwaD